jgi:hypothetical protein
MGEDNVEAIGKLPTTPLTTHRAKRHTYLITLAQTETPPQEPGTCLTQAAAPSQGPGTCLTRETDDHMAAPPLAQTNTGTTATPPQEPGTCLTQAAAPSQGPGTCLTRETDDHMAAPEPAHTYIYI